MPTPISHAAVGFAVATWTQRGAPDRRVSGVATALATLPDIDWLLPMGSASLLSHRALTHSLAFALAGAVVATWAGFTGRPWAERRTRILLVLLLASLSHTCLDALTTYSAGVEFFAPFSEQRYRFLWTPLGDPMGRLAGQFAQETLVVLLPAVLAGWLGLKLRRPGISSKATAA